MAPDSELTAQFPHLLCEEPKTTVAMLCRPATENKWELETLPTLQAQRISIEKRNCNFLQSVNTDAGVCALNESGRESLSIRLSFWGNPTRYELMDYIMFACLIYTLANHGSNFSRCITISKSKMFFPTQVCKLNERGLVIVIEKPFDGTKKLDGIAPIFSSDRSIRTNLEILIDSGYPNIIIKGIPEPLRRDSFKVLLWMGSGKLIRMELT